MSKDSLSFWFVLHTVWWNIFCQINFFFTIIRWLCPKSDSTWWVLFPVEPSRWRWDTCALQLARDESPLRLRAGVRAACQRFTRVLSASRSECSVPKMNVPFVWEQECPATCRRWRHALYASKSERNLLEMKARFVCEQEWAQLPKMKARIVCEQEWAQLAGDEGTFCLRARVSATCYWWKHALSASRS
jgi:hypothetical protein